ncbi:MAG: DUF503 domain-containing protein, partial [Acidimicrobiia bacterium]
NALSDESGKAKGSAARFTDRGGTHHNGGVHAAAITFDLHIPQSRSLKAKRAVIRPIVDGLRHRFRLSVAEVDHLDQWQRATIGVAVIAESDGRVQELLDAVERSLNGAADIEVLGTEVAWLENSDRLQDW